MTLFPYSSYSNQMGSSKIVETADYYHQHPSEWGEFNFLLNNCEHFATFCATGSKSSTQAKIGITAGVMFGPPGFTLNLAFDAIRLL